MGFEILSHSQTIREITNDFNKLPVKNQAKVICKLFSRAGLFKAGLR